MLTAASVRNWGRQQVARVLTPNLHAFLFCGSMPPRLHTFTSALTHLDQDFLGLPRSSTAILMIELMHEVAHTTSCPYHLRGLVLRAGVNSCIPNFAYGVSLETSSWGLTPQIQQIIDLSFRQSRCKSGADGAQVSLHAIEQS